MIWLAIPAAAAAAYYLLVLIACARWKRPELPSAVPYRPAVSILKPVHGRDPRFWEAIVAHASQDYPEFELLFGSNSPDDPALEDVALLKKKFPNVKAPPKEDICYATTNRQNAVNELAPEVDLVLVIGSKNSSNSQRLVDTARERGKEGYLIDDVRELRSEWLEGKHSVLVTAGASAPEHLVEQLLEKLRSEYAGQIDLRTLVQEDVNFAPPPSLRSLTVVG